MVDHANKVATTVTFDGKPWLIGGTWTAGGRYPKKPNLRKAAKEELFDPLHSSAVWLKESEQMGWFTFDGKPQSGRALAPLVLSKLSSGMLPWRGVFRMDGGWWVVAVDDAMALHPLWDMWVPEDQFKRFYEENSSKWMTFTHAVQTDTPEESWKWLLDGEDYRNAPKVAPVIAAEQTAKNAVVLMAALGAVIGIGYAGDYFWKVHEADVARHKLMLQQDQAKLNAEAAQRSKALTQMGLIRDKKNIENSWRDWPKPWVNPVSWSLFFRVCQQTWSGKITDHGWTLTNVQCHWSAKTPSILTVQKTWSRGLFATVLHAPAGSTQKSGDIINQTESILLTWKKDHHDGSDSTLSTLYAGQRFWLGQSQKWNGVIQISSGPVATFLAPIPKGTPPQVAKSLHPPVLWRSFHVTFSSMYTPEHWSFWKTAGMVPSNLAVKLGNSNHYEVTGVQYAE